MYWNVPGSDFATVTALVQLLQWSGGRRPASAVGYLYKEEGGHVHRHVIRSYGGVSNFVSAHADVFALEPKGPGETCANIRLLTVQESLLARPCVAPPCRYFLAGKCSKGNACQFSHATATALLPLTLARAAEVRLDALRSQVEYYLSDVNLRHDSFFQELIRSSKDGWIPLGAVLGCPRMRDLGASAEELVVALRQAQQLQVRELPKGAEAVRRTSPLPPFEVCATAQEKQAPLCEKREASLTEQPLVLLKD
eukprot:TRINITY_DN37906_c0_g1_i2.p1 TRINITY_DN37906_c0_g1~~TRINITY_DN37906_c0_g1_i2.p1  ORF type:complete len:265 (+),score=47.17 TRINITY_DN37906_c0_g1_i2:37-795(+)